MIIEKMFAKDIRRPIEGVIKADDESQLETELREYVLTNEAADRLTGFLEDYNQNRSNGAWLSGFFGSGKSHLLKMMAVVLENRTVNGHSALDLFRPKCAANPMLKGLLERAVSTPSRSILFNIDQKADVINKNETDAVLSVFLKVFNDFCSYYSLKPHVAQFERELDEDGLLPKFKEAFQAISGKDWSTYGAAREQRMSKFIDEAYEKVTGTAKANVIDAYRSGFRLSIEDFANLVKAFIERQKPGFRLNFFVDEVGQFVANNTKLMLNLQTLGETLNTLCKNRSWLIVTSQMDLSNVVGGMNREHGNDFTRIEARFKTKIPLTGANADEVIRRRLLEKTTEAVSEIAALYNRFDADLKVLFDFSDGSKRYATYADEEAFITTYPFVPYQFDLFQTTMLNLSTHDAFTGRYTAIAERSMLAVCQDAAKRLCDSVAATVGALVPFDYWFDGIRLSLKNAQINQIIVGERNLNDAFAVRVLKALFLVKYVREFKSTARNLCVLLLDRLDQDVAELTKRIESTLAMLENQSYVQRVGLCYEYLTDEEKDLDKEIKSVDLPPSNIEDAYRTVIFQSILPQRKITCSNHADYPFVPEIDDHAIGRMDAELVVNVITPNHPNAAELLSLKSQKLGKAELTVVLPQSAQLLQDIILYRRTDYFLKQNPPVSQEGSRRTLLEGRVEANRLLGIRIEEALRHQLGEATVLVSGEEVEIATADGRGRLTEGFDRLAARVYSFRKMVEGMSACGEGDIPKFLNNDPQLPLGETESEPEKEMLTVLRQNQTLGQRTTLRMLADKFEGVPYGWRLATIECLVARLWATGKVTLVSGGNEIDKGNVRAALTNTRGYDSLVVQLQRMVAQSEIRAVKGFAQDFFSEPVPATDAKGVAVFVKKRMSDFVQELETLSRQNPYPFVGALEPARTLLRTAASKPDDWIFSPEFKTQTEELLDAKDDLIDPILKILKGPQKAMFDAACRLLSEQRLNLGYIGGNEAADLQALVDSPTVYKGGGLLQVKSLTETLGGKLEILIGDERTKARETLDRLQEQCKGSPEYAAADEGARQKADAAFAELARQIEETPIVSVIRDRVQSFASTAYPQVLMTLAGKTGESTASLKYVQVQTLRANVAKHTLETPADVDGYLTALGSAIRAELEKGNRVLV